MVNSREVLELGQRRDAANFPTLIDTLRNAVSLWLAEDGRFRAKFRQAIWMPAEVLPRRRGPPIAQLDMA